MVARQPADHVEVSQVLKNSFRDIIPHLSQSCIYLMKRFIISSPQLFTIKLGRGIFSFISLNWATHCFHSGWEPKPLQGQRKHRKGEGIMGQKALPMVESYELVDQKSSPSFRRLWHYSWTRWLPKKEYNHLLSPKDKKLQLAPHSPPPVHFGSSL